MKPGYAALISLIQTATELPYAECFTITLLSGQTLRYTDLDVPVWLNGIYFAANAVRIQGLKFKQTTGVDVDEQEIDLIAGPTDTINGVPFLQAIRNHVLDGCYIQRDRAFFNPATQWPPEPGAAAYATGGVTLFKGRVAAITAYGRTTAKINLKSDLVLLDIDFPRNVWQASCLHTLYDSGCGLSKGVYQGTGIAGAGATTTVIPVGIGGSGASLSVTMSGAAGSPILRVVLTSAAGVNNGYAVVPAVTVTDPTGTGAVLRALISPNYGGRSGAATYQLYGIQVVSGGSGYTNPTITIAAGAFGTATAIAVLSQGSLSVTGITVVSGGSGYSNATAVALSGGGGTGATAVAHVTGGVITSVSVTNGGTGYSGVPAASVGDNAFTNFAQGTILFQGGQNAGVLAQIKSASGSTITLANPLNFAPASGDVFSIWPGCDHTLGPGGCAKFNNQANYRGFPYVPPPETAY